ncbi:putative methylesterase 13, chloroplastic isoform X2 [Selaginella moellendorffii]|nr:putative methylesterase 13, chloroplastic isoform X2 [Selaginella moellendorffii]|eukprot:XP_002971545.2 putative methylesterase 13, chloroplastic isoform X2 [Selaginella moellendorffii]
MAKFVFVHGAGHGAWCWYKVLPCLRQAGHAALAVDLTSAGISTVDPNQVRTLAHYSQPLIDLIESLPQGDKIVLVGHSLGGIVVTYAMEKYPSKIGAAIFVVAQMLPSGPKAIEIRQKAAMPGFLEIIDSFCTKDSEVATSSSFKPEHRQSVLYHLCSPEDVELGNLLVKPNPLLPPSEIAVEYTKEKYGSIPRYYIKGIHDVLMPVAMQDYLLENNPPDGVLELPSDHSPFFSTPDALVEALTSIATSLK